MPRYTLNAQNGACAISKHIYVAELQLPDGLRATCRQNEALQIVITCHQTLELEVNTMAVLVIMAQQMQPT